MTFHGPAILEGAGIIGVLRVFQKIFEEIDRSASRPRQVTLANLDNAPGVRKYLKTLAQIARFT
jgi:glycosyltransferase A (GT-A) superfamily protein (DUF2064 family)